MLGGLSGSQLEWSQVTSGGRSGGSGECFKTVAFVASFFLLLLFPSPSFSPSPPPLPFSIHVCPIFSEKGTQSGSSIQCSTLAQVYFRWAVFSRTPESSMEWMLPCCGIWIVGADQQCLGWRLGASENLLADEAAGTDDKCQEPVPKGPRRASGFIWHKPENKTHYHQQEQPTKQICLFFPLPVSNRRHFHELILFRIHF